MADRIEARDWRGQVVAADWLLARYRLSIKPGAGPWRVAGLREVHGRPLLRTEFAIPAGQDVPFGAIWRSVGGLEIRSDLKGQACELPVDGGSYYVPANGPGPWTLVPVGGGEQVQGLGLALGLPDGPPEEQDNRYQTVLVTWRYLAQPGEDVRPDGVAPPEQLPAGGLLGWELPNRPLVTAEEWARFDALGAAIAKLRRYHLIPAILQELARRGCRVALRPDSDGEAEANPDTAAAGLIAGVARLREAGIPGPVFVILDSEPNLHGRPVPPGYWAGIERMRRMIRERLGAAVQIVSPPMAVAQADDVWLEAGRAVIARCDLVGLHCYGQLDDGLIRRSLALAGAFGLPLFVAELGDSQPVAGIDQRMAALGGYLRLLAGKAAAVCLFILGTADPQWDRFVLPTDRVGALRTAFAAPEEAAPVPVPVPEPADASIPAEIRDAILLVCRALGADPNVIGAICWQESGFRPDAIGDGGRSVGLMQLHDQGLGAGLTRQERLDPERNLRVGVQAHLAYLAEFGSIEAAVTAHNAGGPAVRQALALFGPEGWRQVVHHRQADGTAVMVAEVYTRPVLAKAEEYRRGGVFAVVDPLRVQLDAIWGVSEQLLSAGRDGQAWQLRAAVIAIKEVAGLA